MSKGELLEKPYWSINDITEYFEIGRTTAKRMYEHVLEVNPKAKCPFSSKAKLVNSDMLLEITISSCRKKEKDIWG